MKNFNLNSSWVKVFFLFTLFCSLTKIAIGAHVNNPSINGSGVDQYGAYIEFSIDIRDQSGSHSAGNLQEVTTGHISYNGSFIVTFSASSSSWDDQGINVQVNQGYAIASNGSGWTGMLSSTSGNQNVSNGSSGEATLTIRWYIPQYMLGQTLNFSSHEYVTGYYVTIGGSDDGALGDQGNQDWSGSSSASFSIPSPSFSFSTSNSVDSMSLSYSYTNTTIPQGQTNNYTIQHWIQGYNTVVTDNSNVSPSGSLNVPISNYNQSYNFVTSATGQGGYMTYTQNTLVTVPPYIWPTSLNAQYNSRDSVLVSWSVPVASGSGYITGDNFEVQRSTDSTFATNVTEVTQSEKYNPSQTNYQIWDNISNITGGTTVYYRLRRTATQSAWGWNKYVESSVPVNMNTTIVADTSVDTTVNGSPEAVIRWQPFSGVWTSGTTFTLIKFNKTTGAQAATINLTETQARSGQYIDQSISYCNEFIYSIQVNLGGGYASPPEITVPGSILAVNIGNISDLTVSKGYFPDHVNLQWNSQGQFDDYIVERKVYGDPTSNFVQIATVAGTSTSTIQTTDATGQPGVYYEYSVVGAVKCNNETRYSLDTLYGIGFRSPTGNIYGRITYANGQSVGNVAVRLQNDDNPQLGTSVHLTGQDSSYLVVDSLNTPFVDSAFTVEAWIRPDDSLPENQVVFSRGGQYELGFNGSGQLYFTYNGTTVTGPYLNPSHSYIHVAGIHSSDSLTLMINDTVIAKIADPFTASSNADTSVFIGRNRAGNNYKGYIDEMRVWNVARTPQQIATNYTRLITGGETGLVAYWRFDETITDQFYDISHNGENYNENDGTMSPNFVVHSNVIPDPDQLSLMAYTDSSGNYMISGIPYTGQGTTYTIIPTYETHQFSPSSSNRLVSASASTYDVDFTDNSSFPVTGYVYYFNSSVPVQGVDFLIDGKYAQANDGSLLQTDATGKFSISVPVGYHEVKAVMNNHVFEYGGLITDQFGNNLNYQAPVGPLTLYDSTTIRFIGRVAGGAVQEGYPLGHSLSTNNLGAQLEIILNLPSGTKYGLYSGNAHDSTVFVDHLLPSDQTDSSKIHKTRVVYDSAKDQIEIYPDSLTGEFEANLIPVQFIAESVTATGWGNILSSPVSLNFTNAFIPQYSVYNYEDSSQSNSGAWNYTHYKDTVVYNSSYQFIKRVTPSVSVMQLSPSGQPLSYFGDTAYIYQTLAGGQLNIPLINNSNTGLAQYLLGYPVFTQNKPYQFEIKAFEQYPFYSGVKQDGTPIPGVNSNGQTVDNVPTSDGEVSVYDNISDGAPQPDTLSLNSAGIGYYNFTAGDPVIQAPGTKDLAVSVKFGQATNVNWSWIGNPQLQAYVLGGKLSGTDFVTAGPNKVLMVLRDPPGNNSYSFVQSGSTITSSSTYTGTVDQTGDETLVTDIGTKLVTFTGVGAGVINSVVATNGITVGAHHEEHYTGTNTKTSTTTFTTQFQTSSDPGFVGAPADLYVGYSTNITYGLSNNLVVIPRTDLESTDVIIFQASVTSPYLVVERQGLNFGQTFGTLFAYPQVYITNTLMPHLLNIRNNFLLPASSITPTQAQAKADNENAEVYVSKLDPTDPNFGKSNNDATAFGSKATSDPFGNGESYTIYFPSSTSYRTDTIMILNEYVQEWKNQIATNEQEKLNATLLQNYSFHAGSPITYSETTDYHHDTSNSFNFVLSANVVNSIDTKFNGAGAEFDINESLGTQQGGSFDNSSDTTTTMGFELASNGGSEYLSVDVDKANDGGFTFRTKGGATGCPYEPASVTQYYQPGTVIDQPTVQIEVPKITVDNPVVNNVPSTQKASYTLHLSNQSQVQTTATFSLGYANTDSVQGADIAVDGSSIANGRNYYIPAGQTITVVLTLAKGPTAMNYNNIPIVLSSACDTTVSDQVLISAHFVPSCSNVNVATPNNNWVVNTLSPVDQQGNPYLPVTLNNFDETNSLFDHIELQYKPSQNSQWITAMSFYPDSASYNAAQGQKALITNAQGINYNLEMNAATFNDGPYDVRGLAVCQLSPGQYITTPSNVVSGVKDVSPPVLFGSPQPANGILGIGDNIQLNFDKPIAGGLLNPTDFQVTGIRNGSPSDHSVSINLDGKSDYAQSEFNKNLTGRSFTAETWVLPDSIENGTVFSQGNINESIELAFTNDDHLQVIVGKKVIESPNTLNFLQGQWSHVALEYNAVDSTVSAFYNFQEVISQVSVNAYDGTGPMVFGKSISQPNGNYFAGKIQNARIWTQDVTLGNLQLNSLTRLSGSENALLSYYPMDEGNGHIIYDKASGNNMQLTGTWTTPPGKAMTFNGNGYVKINAGTIPITQNMDYTLGLWFKGQPGQTNAALLSNGRGDGHDGTGSKNLFYLGFENGLLTFENNGFEVQLDSNYLDNQWHHVAVAVNRISGVGQMFVDGQMQKYFNAQNIGGIASPYIYAGARVWYDSTNAVTPHIDQYFTGNIDEIRIWNSYLSQSVLDNTYSTRLNGDELGLLAYYPFDTYVQFQGQPYLNFTLGDMINDSNYIAPDAVAVNAQQTDNAAPIKNRGPVANLNFNYVYNNNSLIINLLEPPQAVDKTIVTFKVKGVQDNDGNTMQSPVIWTAYIDQNPLKWGDNELNLTMQVDTPIQFTSYINNSSGLNQNFRIDNLPGWLTASPSSGTIGPEGKQLITFTVNQGLNVGSYSDIAEMINDNNETQGLTVNLTVKGQAPNWSVNPADYKYNMTVFGKIREDGIFSSNPGDILAAFANGKCVGLAYNTYSSTTDLWYAFLTIYSDSIRYNNLEFRIWDAGNGKIYEGIPSTPVPYVSDTVIGTPLNPVIFDGKELMFNNINLNQGWSWISFNLYSPNLSNVSTTLQNGNWQSGDIVKNNDMGFDQYSMYSGWVGYLGGFNNTSMFMLQAANAQTMSYNGTAVDVTKTGIPLKGGRWNYISYLPQGNMTVKDALAGYEASNGDIIKSQTGFDMYAAPNGWVGNLTYLEPGKGYMLYRTASADTTFYYPNLPGILGVAVGNNSQHTDLFSGNTIAYNPNSNQIPVAGNFSYAHNMTMIAVTGNEFHLLPGDKVLAYSGSELIGKAKAITNPVNNGTSFFMNIGGDEPKQVIFKIERNGEIEAVSSNNLDYSRNMEIGTLKSPYVIHFKPVMTGVTVFPNPFSDHVYIDAKLNNSTTTHIIQISVFDANGRLVYQNTPVPVNGTYYQTTWDGKGNNGSPCAPGIYVININIDGVPHASKVFKY